MQQYWPTAPALDDLLLDVVTVIELSDHDREVAENRYQRLKTHLERPSSPLRNLLLENSCLIYAQGSMAIGATIVHGLDDDRFDVDALVDVLVPSDWSNDKALDLLFDALQGFPDVKRIVRCTRCVQLQFAFMHMDVTILDSADAPRVERAGEIFHSPDNGNSARIPANPYGFGQWFRKSVVYPTVQFSEAMKQRRTRFAIDRLAPLETLQRAEQETLPQVVPPRLDAQQVHALKLMKRFLNLRYDKRPVRRPPSIYITKLAVTCGHDQLGLTAQIARFATKIRFEMEAAIFLNRGPDERNPSYEADRLNDRWPTSQADRRQLATDMTYLLEKLEAARDAEIKDIIKIFGDLFGERVGGRAAEALVGRMDQRSSQKALHFERGTGAVISNTAVVAPAVAKSISETPRHQFHSDVI